MPCCSSDRVKLHSHDSLMPARVIAGKLLCLLDQLALQSSTQTKETHQSPFLAAQERVYGPRPTRRRRVLIKLSALKYSNFRRLALETTLASTCRDTSKDDALVNALRSPVFLRSYSMTGRGAIAGGTGQHHLHSGARKPCKVAGRLELARSTDSDVQPSIAGRRAHKGRSTCRSYRTLLLAAVIFVISTHSPESLQGSTCPLTLQ